MATTQEKIYAIIREQFSNYSGALSDGTTANHVPGWDSYSHVLLILTIEERLGVEIDPAETFELEDVGSLVRFVDEKLARATK